MSGRPKSSFRRALNERIKLKGGLSVIYERVANGETLTAIAPDYDVSRPYLRDVLTEGDVRLDLFLSAQRSAAFALAEQGMQIIDNASTISREDIAKAKERAHYRQWLASKLDRETFGDQPLVQINDQRSFGSMFLEALKAPAPKQQLPSGPPALPVLEAHVISEETSHGIVQGRASGNREGDAPGQSDRYGREDHLAQSTGQSEVVPLQAVER